MLGPSINNFENDLPKKIDVLRRYYSYARNVSETKKISGLLREIINVYVNTGIATIHPEHIRVKLKALVKPAKAIISTRKLSTENQIKKELDFFTSINSLFDVAAVECTEAEFGGSSSASFRQNANEPQVRVNWTKIYLMPSNGCSEYVQFHFRMIVMLMMIIMIAHLKLKSVKNSNQKTMSQSRRNKKFHRY